MNSFPDHDADKANGRRTLVIILGRQKAASISWIFPAVSYSVVVGAVATHIFPLVSLVTLCTIPLVARSCRTLKQMFQSVEGLVPVMSGYVYYSRITGMILAASFIADFFIRTVQ